MGRLCAAADSIDLLPTDVGAPRGQTPKAKALGDVLRNVGNRLAGVDELRQESDAGNVRTDSREVVVAPSVAGVRAVDVAKEVDRWDHELVLEHCRDRNRFPQRAGEESVSLTNTSDKLAGPDLFRQKGRWRCGDKRNVKFPAST